MTAFIENTSCTHKKVNEYICLDTSRGGNRLQKSTKKPFEVIEMLVIQTVVLTGQKLISYN